ncbi:MAG TPA: hypothetical protein VF111_03395, partial [Thermoanaerobaculia bacterium]
KAGTALGTREPVIWQRYATVLAFCLATWNNIEAFVWHGARQLEKDGTAIATAALGSWNTSYWGASQAPLPAKPASKLVGIGHGAYQKPKGWPLHRDHVHVRLTFC